MSLHLHLSIIDRENIPILHLPLVPVGQDDDSVLDMVLLSAVETLDAKLAHLNTQLYLKQLDKLTGEWTVSAFVTMGYTKFLLIHPSKVDEATLKIFFGDVHAAFVKYYMSPFSDGPNLDCNGGLSKTIIDASRKLYRYTQWWIWVFCPCLDAANHFMVFNTNQWE